MTFAQPVSNVVKHLAALLSALVMSATTMSATAAPTAAPLRLQWEVERNVFTPEFPDGRSQVAMSLTNLGSKPLPAQGWAIYFSAIAGVELGPAIEGHVLLERVIGTLFRIRPAAGFKAIEPAQTARISFFHPEVMIMEDKAPQAPYLVLDSAPDVALAIEDYKILPLTRPEQLEMGPGDGLVTAQALFDRYQAIVDLPEEALPPVFPTPLRFERRTGTLSLATLPVVSASPDLRAEVTLAKGLLEPYFASTKANPKLPPLRLSVGVVAGQSSPEAYELTVDPVAGIAIKGNTAAGVSRGLQSLRALLPLQAQPERGLNLRSLRIVDAPRFEYRGVMLDVARNFQSKATVFKLLDLMARYKLNKLHLHLTDDEGWRLEIAGIPELTSVGARRGHPADSSEHLPSAHGSGPDLADPHGSGYYSRADYIEILKFATARHIEVIPEIEMPGHARAAVKAMQRRTALELKAGLAGAREYLLSDPDDKSTYKSAQLYIDNVVNPGLPSTYAFIEHVVAEVVALHKQAGAPLATIHVGGDELPNGAWEKSPAALSAMKRLRLASTAELWDYFYDRVDRLLRKQGLFASGWEELGARKVKSGGEDKLVPNPFFVRRGFNVFVWNNVWGAEDLAYRLANAGYKTVLAPVTNLYFDMAHLKHPEEHGHNWAAYIDLDTVFDFNPLDMLRTGPTSQARMPGKEALTDFGRSRIRGLEATLFSETMRDAARIDYMLMPRMLGLAERAWGVEPAWAQEPDATKAAALHAAAWSSFVNQVGKQVLPRLDGEHVGVLYRIPPPGLKVVNGQVLVNSQLPGFVLRYTTDGSEPSSTSTLVSGSIAAKGIIRVAAFDRNGRQGRSSVLANP